MSRDPKVSYVLPAHNGERFIAESIESVLNQTYRNLELIVVVDGPTDGTPQIVDSFGDPRMVVLKQPNLGMSFARNRGIAVSTGDFIGSISHDDVFLPEKTEIQLSEMERRNLDFSFTWPEVIDEFGNRTDHLLQRVFNQQARSSTEMRRKLSEGNFLLAPSFLGRRRCYHLFSWNVVLFGLQDYALWLDMSQRLRGSVLELPLVRYRVHDNNTSLSAAFRPEYRQFEASVARALAAREQLPSTSFEERDPTELARKYLLAAEDLLSTGAPSQLFAAYLQANRAVNILPTYQPAFELVAKALTLLDFPHPATLVRSIGQNVGRDHQYSLPLVSLSSRERFEEWVRRSMVLLVERWESRGARTA